MACNYLFSKIPNDDEGWSLIESMKKYANFEGYKLRIRGQYLDHSKLDEGESWKNFQDGQPINKSKYLRLYFHRR
jgi:hypothetical protein